jgi:hypothetical protein
MKARPTICNRDKRSLDESSAQVRPLDPSLASDAAPEKAQMIARLLVLAIVIGGVLALVISHITYKLPLSLNLRHDLARMSDAQLVERLEQTRNSYSQVEADAWPFKLWASFRGSVRHHSAYAFLSWQAVSSSLSWQFGPSFAFGVGSLLSKRSRALMRMHLAICEVRDINDEMKRRVSDRGGPKRT